MLLEKHTNYEIWRTETGCRYFVCIGNYSSRYYETWRLAQDAIPDICKQEIKGQYFYPSMTRNIQALHDNGQILYLPYDHALFFPDNSSSLKLINNGEFYTAVYI